MATKATRHRSRIGTVGTAQAPATEDTRIKPRASARKRGYTKAWERARLAFLAQHPLCVTCQAAGRLTPATEVDHIVPHRGDYATFWACDNWQAMCKRCHSTKTGGGE